MADDTNTAEREAFEAWAVGLLGDNPNWRESGPCELAWQAWQARASLAASAGSTEINGQLYTALNNLFTHLGMEGCITADHAFVWDAMTALKRIDGGVHLDNLAVPVDPEAHRDDMLAAVQLLEDGEWAEHFAKTPIGMRLEDQITKLHSEVAASAGSEPVAWPTMPPSLGQSPVLFEDGYAEGWAKCLAMCKAAFTHPSPPEGMAGWKLVPIEPTDEMLAAAHDGDREYTLRNFGDVMTVMQGPYDHWASMIAAAPPLPASEAKEL